MGSPNGFPMLFRSGLPVPCEMNAGHVLPTTPASGEVFYHQPLGKILMWDGIRNEWYDPTADVRLTLILK